MTNRVVDGFDWLPTADPGFDNMRNMMGAAGYYSFGTMMSGNAGGAGSRDGLGSVYPVNPGRFSFGRAIQFIKNAQAGSTNAGYLKPIGDQLTEGVHGFAFYYSSFNGANCHSYYTVWDAANYLPKFTVDFTAAGVIKVWRGLPVDGSLIMATESGVFLEETWQWCEVKHKIHDTAGYIEVRINTVTVIDLVDIDTNPSGTAQYDSYGYGIRNIFASETAYLIIDDTYFNDLDGSECNDFLGNNRVKSQLTVANGSHLDFSIGGSVPAATNWQSVQNYAEDDTKYVYATVVDDYDLYQMDPNLNSPLVHVVQARFVAKQDDSTQRVLSAKVRIGGINYDNADGYYLDQSYSHARLRWSLNPATGVAFTGAEVNGLEIGPWVKA